jgi:hypothetical protein
MTRVSIFSRYELRPLLLLKLIPAEKILRSTSHLASFDKFLKIYLLNDGNLYNCLTNLDCNKGIIILDILTQYLRMCWGRTCFRCATQNNLKDFL